MPTAAKLVAAITFAALAYLNAHVFIPSLPEGTQLEWFREITALIGLVCGWLVMGGLVGASYGEAISSGIRTSITVAFFALLGFAIYEMLQRSMSMMYDGPMEAVLAVFDLMFYYGKMMMTLDVIGVLLVGGAVGGVVTEWVGRRLP